DIKGKRVLIDHIIIIMKFLVLFALFALASAASEPDFNDRTVKCTVCKYVMGEIEELLTDDSTEETILAKLDEVRIH
ncbi:Hypothetical protein FKW44_018439, partial [Caligus rogercresseyi]